MGGTKFLCFNFAEISARKISILPLSNRNIKTLVFTNFLKRVELSVTLDDAWTKVSRRGGDPGTFDGGVGGAGRVHTLIKKVPFFPFALLPILAKTYSKISKFYILQVE